MSAGESGAGKTEAARVVLQALVVAGGGAGGAGRLLAAAGTLLEAFGNAATARNHNASRFVSTTTAHLLTCRDKLETGSLSTPNCQISVEILHDTLLLSFSRYF